MYGADPVFHPLFAETLKTFARYDVVRVIESNLPRWKAANSDPKGSRCGRPLKLTKASDKRIDLLTEKDRLLARLANQKHLGGAQNGKK
jgi:hypothetical protein